jgi:hypothetical protein
MLQVLYATNVAMFNLGVLDLLVSHLKDVACSLFHFKEMIFCRRAYCSAVHGLFCTG